MKNINENELRNYILKKLQESSFDDLEFGDAMRAAEEDMKNSGENFTPLGASKFEKNPKFKEKFTAALNRANLELPSDEAEVEHYAQLLKKRKAQEDRFGKGSLNEDEMMNEEAYEASRYMFFGNLQQIRRQAGLLLDMDEEKLQEILENGHDWAQDHIATAKESIDQVFDFLMNETSSGDMWKSVDVEDKEDEEEGDEFDEEIEEGMGRSHTVGKGTNEKPVDYPETLMREAIKDILEGAFDKYTSTTSTSGQFSKGGGFKKQTLTTVLDSLSKWMESTFKNKFIIKQEMPPQTTDKSPEAKKPTVYIWIPTNNPNAINVEYRNITSAVNYVTTNKHIEKILKVDKFDKLGVLVQLMKGKDATKAKFSLAMKQTGDQAEPATNQPATTQTQTPQPAVTEGYSVNEEDNLGTGVKLSDVVGAVKNVLKGKKGELEKLRMKNWKGTPEGWHEFISNKKHSAGTNESVEEEIEESSSDSLANKHGENAKPNVSYLKKEGYENIIELQDNQANYVFTLLKQDGPEEAIEYLKEFHKPGTHNILSEIKKSTLDKSYEKDGYTLTWNPSVGFIKLSYRTN